jgi:hypothetical protein
VGGLWQPCLLPKSQGACTLQRNSLSATDKPNPWLCQRIRAHCLGLQMVDIKNSCNFLFLKDPDFIGYAFNIQSAYVGFLCKVLLYLSVEYPAKKSKVMSFFEGHLPPVATCYVAASSLHV